MYAHLDFLLIFPIPSFAVKLFSTHICKTVQSCVNKINPKSGVAESEDICMSYLGCIHTAVQKYTLPPE